MSKRVTVATIAVLAAAAITVWAIVLYIEFGPIESVVNCVFTPEDVTRFALWRLRTYLNANTRMFSKFELLEGDVEDVEKWLAERMKHDHVNVMQRAPGFFIERDPHGKGHLVDCWGSRLVYQCPAADPKYVYRLYSLGENRRDERGMGDDVEVSMTYASIADMFEDPNFDGNTYKKYRGQLTVTRKGDPTVIRHPGWPPTATTSSKPRKP